jgi:hypothetical protein
MTTTPSLGELLRRRIESDKQAVIDEQERLAAAERAKAEIEERTIRTFFQTAQATFEADILSGIAAKPLTVGHRHNTDVASAVGIYASLQIDNPRHKYYKYWEEFAGWASANGLQAKWTYAHDGMGVDSWQVLSVVPA